MNLQEASLNLTEQEYRDIPKLSYSNISTFDREGYGCINALFDKFSSPSLTFGSLVDCMITSPEELPDKFLIADVPELSDSMSAIANYLLEEHQRSSFALITDEEIIEAANILNFYKTYKDATRVSKVREGVSEYYNILAKAEGKTIVSNKTNEDALKIVNALNNHPVISKYIRKNTYFSKNELLFQLQFEGVSPDRIPFKGMLDIVYIDHDNKVICPCDLKTTKDVYTFEESFYKYRYYLQAEMYRYLLQQTIQEKCPELQDYKIADYQFIAVDRNIFKPIIFQWKYADEVVTSYGQKRKTWRELLIDLDWALKNVDELIPLDWYLQIKTKGVVEIKNYSNEN